MPDLEKETTANEDATGRRRLVANVLFSWGGHFVLLIAGFILPRMIDRQLGQEVLGIWDFSWSLVGYFGLVSTGIASSVNRYVARYRMAGDLPGVNAIVSSASCVMAISASLVLGLAVAASLLIPHFFGVRLGEGIREAQWVVFYLGASMAVEMALQAYNGVLTGCHRWGLVNVIESGWHAATVTGMVFALLWGQRLATVSLMYLIGVVLACVTKMIFAYRVCEGLQVRLSFITWETLRRLLAFGAKTLIPGVSNLLLNQTTSIIIVAHFGPAVLALYSRPRSLILQVNTLVKKMAVVLIPTTSSLQSQGNLEGVQELLTKSVRYSCYLVLPIILVLVVFGGPIMGLWMGPRYDDGWLPAILAVGSLVTMVQAPVWPILVGLNAHGRAGIAELLASLSSALLIILCVGSFNRGLLAVGIAVSVPLAIMNLVYLPLLIHRRVGLGVRRYFVSVMTGPMIHILPFALCLVVARLVFKTGPLTGLLYGGTVGGVALAVVYYRYVLPDRVKTRVFGWGRLKGSVT